MNRPGASTATRVAGAAALAALSAITAVVSYLHALFVCRVVGNGAPVAELIPFVPDLMIVTASLAIFDAARRGRRWPLTAIPALVVGIGSTVAMNVAAGWPHGLSGALVAALAPVAFVLTFETLMFMFRAHDGPGTPAPDPAAAGRCPHGVASTADEAVVAAFLHGRDCLDQVPSQRGLAASFGLSRGKVAELVGALNGQHPPEPPEPGPESS